MRRRTLLASTTALLATAAALASSAPAAGPGEFRTQPERAPSAGSSCSNPAGWSSSANGTVRVWSRRSGELPKLLADATVALDAETADMGNPLPDDGRPSKCADGNPDSLIDVYLANESEYQPRGHKTLKQELEGKSAFGVSIQTTHSGNGTCSAYVLVNRGATSDPNELKTTLVHELYHVLQFAHNCRNPVLGSWFTEASATWAEIHYGPSNPRAKKYVNEEFDYFQRNQPRSLGEGDPYENFIWPLFMAQEGTSVAAAWDALRPARTPEQALKAIDSVLPFAKHFRDFAVRDRTKPYREQGSSTDGPLFQTAARDAVPGLPRRSVAARTEHLAQTHGKKRTDDLTVPANLEARYLVLLPPAKRKARYVKLDFTKLPGTVNVDALVRVAGRGSTLERRKLDSKKLTFCRDDPADDISSLVIVLSNHALGKEKAHKGEFTYETSAHCKAEVHGSLDLTASLNRQDNTDCVHTYSYQGNWTGAATISNTLDPQNSDTVGQDNSTTTLRGNLDWLDNWSDCSGAFYNVEAKAAFNNVVTGAVETIYSQDQVDLYVQFDAPSIGGSLTVKTNEGPQDSQCLSNDSGTYPLEAQTLFVGHYTIPIPPGGGTTTVHIDEIQPADGQLSLATDNPCFPAADMTEEKGTLTVTVPPRKGG